MQVHQSFTNVAAYRATQAPSSHFYELFAAVFDEEIVQAHIPEFVYHYGCVVKAWVTKDLGLEGCLAAAEKSCQERYGNYRRVQSYCHFFDTPSELTESPAFHDECLCFSYNTTY